MNDSPLMIKSKELALDIIKVCRDLRISNCESALINQLLRSGTSVGANVREAQYAHGTADFIARLQIALKECSETEYWIELLLESGFKAIVDKFGDKPSAMLDAGVAYAVEQIIDLFANGIRAVHIYTMNRPETAERIMANLRGIIGDGERA